MRVDDIFFEVSSKNCKFRNIYSNHINITFQHVLGQYKRKK